MIDNHFFFFKCVFHCIFLNFKKQNERYVTSYFGSCFMFHLCIIFIFFIEICFFLKTVSQKGWCIYEFQHVIIFVSLIHNSWILVMRWYTWHRSCCSFFWILVTRFFLFIRCWLIFKKREFVIFSINIFFYIFDTMATEYEVYHHGTFVLHIFAVLIFFFFSVEMF